MANTHAVVCWVAAALCLLTYLEGGRGQEITYVEDGREKEITLDGLSLSNYTLEEVKVTTPRYLQGWYRMASGFLSAVHSKSGETIDLIIKYVNGKKVSWPDSAYEFLKLQYAMFGCIVVGIVFVVIMALTGLIFFVCRMCGNCGGNRIQVVTDKTSTWRKVLILSLLVLVAALLPAVIISFTINNSLKGSLNKAEKTIISSLHDSETFINNTELQVQSLVHQGLVKVLGGVARKVEGVKDIIAERLGKFTTEMNVLREANEALSGWHSFPAKLEEARNACEVFNGNLSDIKRDLSDWREQLESSLSKCSEAECSKIDVSVFTLNEDAILDSSVIGEIVENLTSSLQSLVVEEYRNIAPGVTVAIKGLPSKIAHQTLPIRQAILSDLKHYEKEILNSEILKAFTETARTARKMLQELHDKVEERLPDAHKYDKHSWYISLAIFIIMAVVVAGLLLGLLCGICGHQNKKQAAKRTTLSNTGGLTIMFIVYWMFFFSVLLMLFTTTMFAVGGMIEAYVCRPAFEREFTTLDKVMAVIQHKIGESNETSLIKDLKPSDALRICGDNGTIYAAFNLKYLNISSLFNYRERLKIEERKKALKEKSHPGPIFYNDDYEKLFSALIEALHFNTSVIDKLRQKLMDGYEAQIQLISEITDQNVKETGRDASRIVGDVQTVEEGRMHLSNIFEEIRKTKDNVVKYNKAFKLTDGMMPVMIEKEMEEFIKGLMTDSDIMIELINENFETKLAPCRPLWNIFDASRTVLCKHYVLPLNGIWFATGWALFFYIPTIIVSTMLSKHFLRMQYTHSEEKEEKDGYDLEDANGYPMKPVKANCHL